MESREDSQRDIALTLIKKIRSLPERDLLINTLLLEFYRESKYRFILAKETIEESSSIIIRAVDKIDKVRELPFKVDLSFDIHEIKVHIEDQPDCFGFEILDCEEILDVILTTPYVDVLTKKLKNREKRSK